MNILRKRSQQGFTLIELMIIVAVVGVLAAISYPSYQDSVRKSKRAEAKSSLLENAQRLERCFTTTSTYKDCSSVKTGKTEKEYYSIDFELDAANKPVVTSSTYTLTATAIGPQAKDTKCTTFSINEKGIKTAKDSAGTDSAECW